MSMKEEPMVAKVRFATIRFSRESVASLIWKNELFSESMESEAVGAIVAPLLMLEDKTLHHSLQCLPIFPADCPSDDSSVPAGRIITVMYAIFPIF